MGCICGKIKKSGKPEISLQPKTYSWDLRKKETNIQDYTVENLDNSEILRAPKTINGEQFFIRNCIDSVICLLDFMDSVIISNCNGCSIILGPAQGSVYLRNCSNCICVVACGQFRARECEKCTVFLHSTTMPVIEMSTGMQFGTYKLSYPQCNEHLESAKLNLGNQLWKNVHDFTSNQGDPNWSFIRHIEAKDVVKTPSEDLFLNHNLTIEWK